MFERLVSERVSRKAAKAQGRMTGRLAILIVDLAESQVTTQLGIPAYQEDFVNALRRSFGKGLNGYDVITFCEQADWGQELIAHFVQHESTVSESVVRERFGTNWSSSARIEQESSCKGAGPASRENVTCACSR
ncbi:MAG: hypothetical protein GEU68_16665 [Actinobacteria bacterium]|nr:hypothetical protein [Actinomycetota bacterium]